MVEMEFYDAQEDMFAYDIDVSIDILQAQVHQQKPPPKPPRTSPAVAFPRMSKEKWYKLSPGAHEIWANWMIALRVLSLHHHQRNHPQSGKES